jgi:drug/metabolite transporter (DMT)-like permease
MGKALIQLHTAVFLWGFTAIFGKLITLDAATLVWYRMLLTAIFMLAIISFDNFKKLSWIGFLMALHWLAFYASIKLSNASVALVCLATSSLFTSIIAPILNNTSFKIREVLLGTLSLVGMYCIYHFQVEYKWGIITGIIAAFLSAVFTVYNKRIANEIPVKTMVFYEMASGFILLSLSIPVLLQFTPEMHFLPQQIEIGKLIQQFPQALILQPNDWIWLICISLFCTVWAQTLALNALKKLNAFTVALSVNMEPIYGVLLAIIFLNEGTQLGLGFIIGMCLIMLSVGLQMVQLLKRKNQ